MLAEIYTEALLVDEELADQVWEGWDRGRLTIRPRGWGGGLWQPKAVVRQIQCEKYIYIPNVNLNLTSTSDCYGIY
jgi:hypothetical protein